MKKTLNPNILFLMETKNQDILSILDATPHYIDTRMKVKNNDFYITFIYGMPQQEHRAAFWDSISLLGNNRDTAWLLSGDFNDILDNVEKVGGPERCEGTFIPFRSCLSKRSVGYKAHREPPVMERIEMFSSSASPLRSFPSELCVD